MLTSKQRARLFALANAEQAILQVGKGGISDALIKQVDDALTARELIKLRVLETAPEDARELAEEIATATRSDVVRVVGRVMILFRRNHKQPKIELG